MVSNAQDLSFCPSGAECCVEGSKSTGNTLNGLQGSIILVSRWNFSLRKTMRYSCKSKGPKALCRSLYLIQIDPYRKRFLWNLAREASWWKPALAMRVMQRCDYQARSANTHITWLWGVRLRWSSIQGSNEMGSFWRLKKTWLWYPEFHPRCFMAWDVTPAWICPQGL